VTSAEDRFDEFLDRCVDDDDDGTRRLDDSATREREADRFRALSDYHAKAVRDHLDGEATLLAVEEGYYVMLHKANEALALAGFKPGSHHCTLLGLRGVFDAPDLADLLRRASNERQNVDYYMNPETPELEEFNDPEQFVTDQMDDFVNRINQLVKREGLR